MSGYVEFPLVEMPEDLAVEALEFLMESIPGWVPQEGHLEVWMIEVWARMVSEARIVAGRVPLEIFQYFGQSLVGVERIGAESASVLTTWTMVDMQGYTVPAGTIVAYRVAGDELIAFEVLEDVVVPPNSATASDVVIVAVQAGAGGNALGPSGLELVDSLAFVESVTASAASAGGVDSEPTSQYLDRLRAELQLLSPRLILPQDFAVFARRVPGVARALAIDLYDPVTDTYNNERTVTVAVVDADGAALLETTKDDVRDLLSQQREVNFIVHVIDPTFTVVDVAVEFTKFPTIEADEVVTQVTSALEQYINPGTWGGGLQTPPEWSTGTGTVRYLEVAAIVNNVSGVDYITALTLNGSTVDVVLAGAAPLPQLGTATVAVAT
ncbi:MAG: baseplate J/gp47 family protein [Dermatophilaceae bacterium]|nr:baseplate J/gp47 family protein [Intrasporangiaceae bacterium]